MNEANVRMQVVPVLPLREVVVFPGTPAPLIVGRARSVSAITAAGTGGAVLLVAQRRADVAHPSLDDLFSFGTLGDVTQAIRLPDGNTKILVEGRRRARVRRFSDNGEHYVADIELVEPSDLDDPEVDALARTVKAAVERYVKLNRAAPPDMLMGVNAIVDPSSLADLLVGVLKLNLEEKQELLELVDVKPRLERVYKALQNENEFLQVERKLRNRVWRERDNSEREVWLDEQMKAMQKKIDDKDQREVRDDLDELQKLLASRALTEAARARAEREMKRLAQMNPMSAEATVIRGYLDWLLALPWTEESRVEADLARAAAVLDEEHYGLGEVKDRILEHLAVSGRAASTQGSILCLVGPPGVGKTSFARSIARATGRPFARIALGGVRDEAEIRGHRRTYIGAMPGRLMQAMKRAGTIDPVLLLDEVDKMSSDIRGDPASALLEVLDPEQNGAFSDHYLDMDYDLSKVMFLCTANTLHDIPIPLLDRLEVIELSGYTEEEKGAIARRYLLPKQLAQAGLTEEQLQLGDDALQRVIRRHTRESGVRGLERQLARVCRKVARRAAEGALEAPLHVDEAALDQMLGPPRHDFGRREDEDQVGLVKGLSVSTTGGELLNIEVAAVPGKGKLITTGKLGEVLKESAAAMFTYIRSRADALGLEADFHETQDFHVHYPGVPGGVEGPSAGIAMATAMVSALTGIPARSDTAMTGEITLRGRVLPVGGIKEKVLAAHRGGITRVLVPEGNRKDLRDVPEAVREALEILPVDHMDVVLREALTMSPTPPAAAFEAPVVGPDENSRPSA
ncbi:MAG TPA: endopeptidase La [Myxococcota bacterium]|nr:endopeptidase La [Myxococcota bacterium]